MLRIRFEALALLALPLLLSACHGVNCKKAISAFDRAQQIQERISTAAAKLDTVAELCAKEFPADIAWLKTATDETKKMSDRMMPVGCVLLSDSAKCQAKIRLGFAMNQVSYSLWGAADDLTSLCKDPRMDAESRTYFLNEAATALQTGVLANEDALLERGGCRR